jgi:hypothetical protein
MVFLSFRTREASPVNSTAGMALSAPPVSRALSGFCSRAMDHHAPAARDWVVGRCFSCAFPRTAAACRRTRRIVLPGLCLNARPYSSALDGNAGEQRSVGCDAVSAKICSTRIHQTITDRRGISIAETIARQCPDRKRSNTRRACENMLLRVGQSAPERTGGTCASMAASRGRRTGLSVSSSAPRRFLARLLEAPPAGS